MTARQAVVVDARLDAGRLTEIAHHHVRTGDDPVEDLATLGRAIVEGDAFLALEALQAGPLRDGALVAVRITFEVFDLDHPSAEIGQQGSAERGGVEPGQLDHRHPGQRGGRQRIAAQTPQTPGEAGISGVGAQRAERRLWAAPGSWPGGPGARSGGWGPRGGRRVDGVAVAEHLGVVHRLRRGPDRLDTDVVGLLEDGHPLGQGSLVEPPPDRVCDHLGRLAPGQRLGVPLGQIDGLEEGPQQVGSEVGELQPLAVSGEGVHSLQRRVSSRRSQVLRELWCQLGVDPRVQVIGGQTLNQAGLHFLADPGVASDKECGQHALQRGLSGAEAGFPKGRVPGTVPAAGHESGLGGHHRFVTLDAGQRPPWPEPSHRAVHQVGPCRRQVGVAEAEPLGLTRPPALDHDVGGQCEVASPVAAFGTG